ncbi:preprotein translocase subunit SecG [Myxococcota bacterium]|nr:preprotein translocase subunit SecG [Myxococcota bacterium]
METVLYIVHILVCLALLPIILLQSGKGGGVSATFGGGGAGTVFGSRGASSFLTKMTSGAAMVFLITSMALSWYASRSRSVVSDQAVPTEEATKTVQPGAADQVPAPATSTAAQ